MKPATTYRAAQIGISLAFATAVMFAQSKYETPFENYRRTLDLQAFGKGLENAGGQTVHLEEDIKYLASVLAPGSFDSTAQELARQQLELLAFSVAAYSGSAATQDYFRPAIEALQAHVPDAPADVESKWAGSLVSLTAFVGIQPTPPTVGLIYRMLDGKNQRLGNIALLALARIKPLPPGAAKILLSRGADLDQKGKLEMWVFALEDPDVRQAFLRYLESENVEDQRLATRVLSQSNMSPQPILDQLVLLKGRKDLDSQVAANLDKVFARKGPTQ